MLKTFCFEGPLGNIECLVEPNRSTSRAVLIMSHGFRGSRESGGRAAGLAYLFAEQFYRNTDYVQAGSGA